MPSAAKPRIFATPFAAVYPLYVAKLERKGRTKSELDVVVRWLTGYSQAAIEGHIRKGTDFETFLAKAPQMNPARSLITGVVCGVRVEEITDPTMQGIRYLDKMVDELAKGKAMEKVLRTVAQQATQEVTRGAAPRTAKRAGSKAKPSRA